MRDTKHNQLAGNELRRKRGKTTTFEFAAGLSHVLGIEIIQSSLYYYESGRTAVPAAVLLAADEFNRQPAPVRRAMVRQEIERQLAQVGHPPREWVLRDGSERDLNSPGRV